MYDCRMQTTLSTTIDSNLKKALAAFCKKKGLKIQSVVEFAIREQLEDEIDLAAYDQRKNEEEVRLTDVLKKLGRWTIDEQKIRRFF